MITVNCALRAPEGKFRIIKIDRTSDTGELLKDADTLFQALSYVTDPLNQAGDTIHYLVYRDTGEQLFNSEGFEEWEKDYLRSRLTYFLIEELLSEREMVLFLPSE